jgi:CHAD domain-containing protein
MTPERPNKPLQVEWIPGADAAENARTRLPQLVVAYFAEGRKLLESNPPPAALHALRLATKKVRYTLELFKPCYGAGFDERISALKALQQMLGEINDTVAAEHTIEAALGRRTPELAKVARFLRARAKAKANEFKRHWTEVFDAPGQERWWINYLARPAGLGSRKRPRRMEARRQEGRPTARETTG